MSAPGAAFYADEAMISEAINRRTGFNLIHLETMFKVDIFISQERPFDRQLRFEMLDIEYLREAASAMQVSELLERRLDEVQS